MDMARYTRNDLKAQIASVNDKLYRMNSQYLFKMREGADATSGVTTVDVWQGLTQLHAVAIGTPAHCHAKMYETALDYLYQASCDELRRVQAEFTGGANHGA
jgi:hypothetical protein